MCGENKECSCCKKILIKDNFTFGKKTITDEGFLMSEVILARTGIQDYFGYELGFMDDPNKVFKVWRPEEEVFDSESMKSFEGKPVTNNHPPELINIDNVKIYQVGYTGTEIFRKDDLLIGKIIVTDKNAIQDIEKGKNQVSNGYNSDFDFQSGVNDEGEYYDLIQRNIRGNHVAIVDNGRCGETCKIQDSEDKMPKKIKALQVGDATYDVPEGSESVVAALREEIEKLKKELEESRGTKDSENEINYKAHQPRTSSMNGQMGKGEREGEEWGEEMKKENRDELEGEEGMVHKDKMRKDRMRKDDDMDYDEDEIEKRAEERMHVTDVARKLIPSFDCKGVKLMDIKKAIVSEKKTTIVLDSKSNDYINACFDVIAEDAFKGNTSEVIMPFDKPAYLNDGEALSPREKFIQDQKERSK